MSTCSTARAEINRLYNEYPELFPAEMAAGYKFNGWTGPSKKMPTVRLRRIRLLTDNEKEKETAYTVAPCDLLPYMTGMVNEVEKALFLKRFGVPDWALTYVFGRNDMYWYRQRAALGRYDIVGTTVKTPEKLPTHLLCDEKHAKFHGDKCYIATTVGGDCVLGATISQTADAEGLTIAYGQFKDEAQRLQPEYQPATVNTDGWRATQKAWLSLFPSVTIILCFLHAFLRIRDRCKRFKDQFKEIRQHVWDIYHSDDAQQFQERLRQLQQWTMGQRDTLSKAALAALDKLCARADQFCIAFDFPEAHRTSNMIDRHMEPMARWLFGSRFFHGHLHSANLQARAWALLHNFGYYCPRATVRDGSASPVHKLNQFTYRDNWLENLLVASSCQGVRFKHKIR